MLCKPVLLGRWHLYFLCRQGLRSLLIDYFCIKGNVHVHVKIYRHEYMSDPLILKFYDSQLNLNKISIAGQHLGFPLH